MHAEISAPSRPCTPKDHAPLPGPCTLPGTMHTHPCGQTDTCKNITFATSLRTVMVRVQHQVMTPRNSTPNGRFSSKAYFGRHSYQEITALVFQLICGKVFCNQTITTAKFHASEHKTRHTLASIPPLCEKLRAG